MIDHRVLRLGHKYRFVCDSKIVVEGKVVELNGTGMVTLQHPDTQFNIYINLSRVIVVYTED